MKTILILFFFFYSKPTNLVQSSWIEGKYEIGHFFLSFPTHPTYSHTSFHGWTSKDKNGQVSYLMSYLEAPQNIELSMSAVEGGLLPSMLEGDTPISKHYFTYNGYNAMDFLFKSTQPQNLYKKGRVIIIGQKLYVLQVYYYYEYLADFDRFTNSLRFY